MNHDPRITAYAVGELEARERETFEAELRKSDLLEKEMEEMSELVNLLSSAPKSEDKLSFAEREQLLAECSELNRNQRSRKRMGWISFAAAACLLFLAWPAYQIVLKSNFGAYAYANRAYSPTRDNQEHRAQAEATSAPAAESWSYKDPQSESSLQKQLLSETPAITAQEAPADSATPSDATRLLAFGSEPRIPRPAYTRPQRFRLQSHTRQLVRQAVQEPVGAPTMSTPSEFNTEAYASVRENEFVTAKDNPLSTFSIDVDTASYSNVRRFLDDEMRPPAGAIRTEELINYFRYNYPQPTGDNPFSVNLEVSRAPWNPERELVRIGLKGRELPTEERGPANLVFLIDVSGSMDEPNKLPLLQRSLSALVENLSGEDRVAIVTYAGSSGLVLAPTEGAKKREILEAISNLRAGGSTHGSEGIRLAYETAREHFREDGNNRVILCTDGDFNVGVTNESELQKLIERERESGVFLSVLGFGTGNLNDSTMELMANKGNGNYAYIDSISEGRKVLVEQMGSTLFTIAKDVKIQVEFNPARVAGYRLIGYENRLLAKEDFNDDKKDAGEIGAGHTVTALYEIIPAGQPIPGSPSVDPLKYQRPEQDAVAASTSNELLTVKLRYKAPDGDKSKLIEIPLTADDIPAFDAASEDFRFASAVAAFGMKLRGSPDAGKITWSEIQDIARGALGNDPGSYRAEFLTLIEKTKVIDEKKANE